MNTHPIIAGCAALLVAACGSLNPADVARSTNPARVAPRVSADSTGACWAKDATPAVIETVTEQVVAQPAQVSADGSVLYPAVYKTVRHQVIVEPQRELSFETPCAHLLTPEFIASLQRALAVRRVYGGQINGEMTPRTRRAIRAYQQPQGLDSAILSSLAARQLGLVSYESVPEGWERVERD